MSDNTAYVHLSREQCQSEKARRNRRASIALIIAVVTFLSAAAVLYYKIEFGPLRVIGLLSLTAVGAWGMLAAGQLNGDLDELDTPRYFEALKLAETSKGAAALLMGWTEQSPFLSFRDLHELKRAAAAEEEVAGPNEVQLWRERQEQV